MKKGRYAFTSCLAMLLQGGTRQTATKGTTASVMKRKKYWCMMSLLLSFVASSAFAYVDCTGNVDNLSMNLNAQGTITLSLTGGPNATYLCDVDDWRNGVSPTVCRTMYATLMTAKTTGKKVTIRFYSYNSCSSVPSWRDAGQLGWTVLLTD